jgi:DNA-binding transcriptional ArsR family regulator
MAAEPARTRPHDRSTPAPAKEDSMPEAPSHGAPPNPVDLDRLIHGRVRLGIVSALAVHESLTFTELRDLLETSDGNLSVHARRLEDGGYVSCTKSFEGRVPRTEFRLTDTGRTALSRYLDHMEALIDRVRES